jgi:hypothetical protein
MPLEDQEWSLVRCLVVDHLVGTDNPYSVLQQYFPQDVGGWRITQVATENADMLISVAQHASLTDDNPFSIRLLDQLSRLHTIQIEKPGDLAQLQKFLARLRAEKAALDRLDPYGVRIIPATGEAFIDRSTVRLSLKRLVKPDPGLPEPMVLRVTGDEDTGKSYIYTLIRHLAEPCGFSAVRVILDRSSTATDIMRDVSVKIARAGDEPEPVEDPIKRLRYWASWLADRAMKSSPDRPWWFVLDQCNELDPGSDAVELIAQLAICIQELSVPPGMRRPRLVLLGYGDHLADIPLPRKQVCPETVAVVGEPDLRDFFSDVFREASERRKPGAVDESQLEKLVEVAVHQVLDEAEQAKQQGGCYMKAIATATEEAVDVYCA